MLVAIGWGCCFMSGCTKHNWVVEFIQYHVNLCFHARGSWYLQCRVLHLISTCICAQCEESVEVLGRKINLIDKQPCFNVYMCQAFPPMPERLKRTMVVNHQPSNKMICMHAVLIVWFEIRTIIVLHKSLTSIHTMYCMLTIRKTHRHDSYNYVCMWWTLLMMYDMWNINQVSNVLASQNRLIIPKEKNKFCSFNIWENNNKRVCIFFCLFLECKKQGASTTALSGQWFPSSIPKEFS